MLCTAAEFPLNVHVLSLTVMLLLLPSRKMAPLHCTEDSMLSQPLSTFSISAMHSTNHTIHTFFYAVSNPQLCTPLAVLPLSLHELRSALLLPLRRMAPPFCTGDNTPPFIPYCSYTDTVLEPVYLVSRVTTQRARAQLGTAAPKVNGSAILHSERHFMSCQFI